MKRKILAFALAALMLVSVLPTSVFAAEANGECAYQGKAHSLKLVPNAEQVGEPVAPKCGEPGYTLFECPDCGEFFADNFLPSLGEHNWKVTEEKVPATCGVNGKEAVEVCQNEGCNVVRGGDIIPALKHDYKQNVTAGDCITGAVITNTCANCGDVQVENKDPEDHVWSVHPVIDVAPTGGKDGSAHYVCVICKVNSDPIVVKAGCYGLHIREKIEAVAPTCDKEGNSAYEYCVGCNKYYLVGTNIEITKESTVLAAKGHKPVEVSRVPATCTKDGVIKYECSVCGDKTEKAIPAACLYADEPSHVVAPTCTTPGVEIYFCLLCQQPKEVEYIPANGHSSFAEAVKQYAKDLAAYEAAYAEFLANMSEISREPMTITGNDTWEGKPYTFIAPADGVYMLTVDNNEIMYFEGWDMASFPITVELAAGEGIEVLLTADLWYGSIDFEMIILGATNAPVAPVKPIEVLPTCENPGERTWICTVCGAECFEDGDSVAELAPTGHTDPINTALFNPTCSLPGYLVQYCTNANCDKAAVSQVEIEKDGIKYTVPTLVDGKAVHVTGVLPLQAPVAENHVWANVTMNKPTCTEDGDYTDHCLQCKAYRQGILPAGHDLYKGETIDPTCQHYGYTVELCKNCDYYKEIDIVEFALQENYSLAEAESKHNLKKYQWSWQGEGPVLEIIREGNCEEVGLQSAYCLDCEKNLLIVIDGTGEGHIKPNAEQMAELIEAKPDEGYGFAKEPTCLEGGRYSFYPCVECGITNDRWDYKNFNYEDEKGVDPVYGEDYFGEAVLEYNPACTADVHSYNNWLTDVCTCTYTGEYVYSEVVNIPAIDHKYEDGTSAITDFWMLAPTCTSEGLTAAMYCAVCEQWSIDGYNWVDEDPRVAIPATKHPNSTQVDGYGVSCEQFGYNVYKCDDCAEYYYIAEYIPAHGHKDSELLSTIYLCEEGKVIYTYSCKICKSYTVEEAIEGHMHDGALIVDSCLDVKCDNCGVIVEAVHDWFTIQVPATCYEWGYDLKICSECKESYVTNIDDSYLADHSWIVVESKPATFVEAGWEKLQCAVCGAESENVLPVLAGIEFIAVVDNAVASGAGYADSSLIKLTVKLDSAAALKLSSLGFDVVYDKEVVEFVNAEFVSEHFTTLCLANDNDGYVTVTANVPNKAEGDRDDYAVEDHALVNLFFRVKNDTAVKAEFSFANLECRNIEYALLNAEGNGAEIAIVKFMDLNRDGDINLADCMMAYDIMAGASEVMYDVAIDLNKDGKIGLDDVMALYEFYAGIKSYEDVYKMGI